MSPAKRVSTQEYQPLPARDMQPNLQSNNYRASDFTGPMSPKPVSGRWGDSQRSTFMLALGCVIWKLLTCTVGSILLSHKLLYGEL